MYVVPSLLLTSLCPYVFRFNRYHQLNQDVYCCFEKWIDSSAPTPAKSKSKSSSKDQTPARFLGGGGLASGKSTAVGKRNSHKDKIPGKSKMHAWLVFDGHDMLGETAARVAAETFEAHLNMVCPAVSPYYTSLLSTIGRTRWRTRPESEVAARMKIGCWRLTRPLCALSLDYNYCHQE